MHDAELGASLSRLDLHVAAGGPGRRDANSTGCSWPTARGTSMRTSASTTSRRTRPACVDYRGIAAGRGRGVFNGKVVVHADAQRSDARQTNRNLLLTPGAEIDTQAASSRSTPTT